MMRSGIDLLLCMPDLDLQDRARVAMDMGHSRALIPDQTLRASSARIEKLRVSVKPADLHPEMVGSDDQGRLAAELAARSVTLVRNDAGILPLSSVPAPSILCLEPEPVIVTPADTSTFYPPHLAEAIRARGGEVTGIVFPHQPDQNDIASAVDVAMRHDVVVMGTVNAPPAQARMVDAMLDTGKPVVTVALRTPYDLAAYPRASTHLCTYSGHLPSLQALAAALFGDIPLVGRLPAAIPALYPSGHGLQA
jgi:beta-N-acetylhexosaminidase